ncbi:MAG TPA: hypothetical protein DCS42_15020 [Nitrospiraceae bacterium]|nr:hypothetical protein [Nitrospiraceae bacterium]
MSTRATILLTTDNEHWYEELSASYHEETKTEYAVVLEIDRQHKYEISDEGIRVVIEEDTELYREIMKLCGRQVLKRQQPPPQK